MIPICLGLQLPKHFQGEQAGVTMKPFKGSSNKLGPLDSLGKTDVGTPCQMAQFHRGYTHKSRGCPIPDSSSHSYANEGNH